MYNCKDGSLKLISIVNLSFNIIDTYEFNDAITCICLNNNIMAVGIEYGEIYIKNMKYKEENFHQLNKKLSN